MKKYILFLFGALISLVSCKTSAPEQSFTIGRGGGFTGKYDEYLVKNNGEVYKLEKDKAPVLFEKIGKKEALDIFAKFKQLNITSIKFSHPGNMTSYISYTSDNKTYEIKWGDSRNLPPQNVQDFFNSVWSAIRPK